MNWQRFLDRLHKSGIVANSLKLAALLFGDLERE